MADSDIVFTPAVELARWLRTVDPHPADDRGCVRVESAQDQSQNKKGPFLEAIW
jgi:hypothetical protein